MECFYLCSLILDAGSVVLPGNWGRMIKEYSYPPNDGQSINIITREHSLEIVRTKHFNGLPSRLECAFCFPNIESAAKLHARRRTDILYKVSIDPKCSHFYGSWTHVEPTFPCIMDDFYKMAFNYWGTNWKEQSNDTLEILTMSPMTIIEKFL